MGQGYTGFRIPRMMLLLVLLLTVVFNTNILDFDCAQWPYYHIVPQSES